VRGVYSKLLESKEDRWTAQKVALKSSIQGLAQFISALASLPYSGLGGAAEGPDFSIWFQHLHQQVTTAARPFHVIFPGMQTDRKLGRDRMAEPLPKEITHCDLRRSLHLPGQASDLNDRIRAFNSLQPRARYCASTAM